MVTASYLERLPWALAGLAVNDEQTPPLNSAASILGSFMPMNAWSIVGKGTYFRKTTKSLSFWVHLLMLEEPSSS